MPIQYLNIRHGYILLYPYIFTRNEHHPFSFGNCHKICLNWSGMKQYVRSYLWQSLKPSWCILSYEYLAQVLWLWRVLSSGLWRCIVWQSLLMFLWNVSIFLRDYMVSHPRSILPSQDYGVFGLCSVCYFVKSPILQKLDLYPSSGKGMDNTLLGVH
jgi:hypothetical protein